MRGLLDELFYVLDKNLLFTRPTSIDAARAKDYPAQALSKPWTGRLTGQATGVLGEAY
jgi:hypothetical protein